MESIGLFTPPAYSTFMSWSTFWRSPDEKKLPFVADMRDESAEDIRIVIEPRARTVEMESPGEDDGLGR